MPGTSKSPSLSWGAPCACWGMPLTISHAVKNSAIAFTFCLGKSLRSVRGECLGPSCVFLEDTHSLRHTHSTYAWPRVSGMCQSFSKLLWTANLPAFPLSFLATLWFALNVIHYLRQPRSWNSCNCFCQNPLRGRHFALGELQVTSNTGSFAREDFQVTRRQFK